MTDNANWQSEHKFERKDPNLNEDFIAFLADEFPEAIWSTTYVHWHPSVSEYCVYINDVWSGYVPEEYIFKAGFEHYKVWSNAWKRHHEVEQTMDLTRHYVQSCIEFCEEKGSVSSDYLDYVRYFVRIVRNRIMSTEDQSFAVKFLKEWLERNDYSEGSDYLEGILNELAVQPNKRHIRQGRKES